MQISKLLVAANLVTAEQVASALARQTDHGGRIGENLLAIGAIGQEALSAFHHLLPVEVANIAATGIGESDLLGLLMKLVYTRRLESIDQFGDAIKLPHHVVLELVASAVDRRLLRALGTRDGSLLAEMNYALTDDGHRWAQDAMAQSQYVGPAPVTIEAFNDRIHLQKVSNFLVRPEDIRAAFGHLTVSDTFIEKIGPALNSGRAILLYGPPGNGKTSVALSFASIFDDMIYVPYAVMVEGQIMRVYDPSFHVQHDTLTTPDKTKLAGLLREGFDERWAPCHRPFIVSGGELTLEMLDLAYDATANFYEAPLHIKALGGCFIIDDFGRQLVSPASLLNRWIVPLESRVDFLKFHSGKSFSIPFEELVVFSTNIEPEDLMDPAFLRRLPYKLEVGAPTLEQFRQIFTSVAGKQHLTIEDDMFESIVRRITEEKGLELAAYQPKFIVDQIVSTCRFLGLAPHFEARFIDYVMDNLRVRRTTPPHNGAAVTESFRSH